MKRIRVPFSQQDIIPTGAVPDARNGIMKGFYDPFVRLADGRIVRLGDRVEVIGGERPAEYRLIGTLNPSKFEFQKIR